jgi:ribosomal protein S18 acetylase RimI-like enzyme
MIMNYLPISKQNREQINAFIEQHWFSTQMIIRGEIVDMTVIEGIAAMDGDEIVGLITYRICGKVFEITSLDSLQEGKGIGKALLDQVIAIAKDKDCQKVSLVTTNDNINAIRFYQKRGFDLVKVHLDAVMQSRILKPEIPLTGQNGIPIKHELEFELLLGN